jgi:hypothetical protein
MYFSLGHFSAHPLIFSSLERRSAEGSGAFAAGVLWQFRHEGVIDGPPRSARQDDENDAYPG